jgi:hypothetical protein
MNMQPPPIDEKREWLRKMFHAYVHMLTWEEAHELEEWEDLNLGQGVRDTSDWPGWIKHIGPPPWKARNN